MRSTAFGSAGGTGTGSIGLPRPAARAGEFSWQRVITTRLTVACDGQRTFRVYEDEVRAGPAAPLDGAGTASLAQLLDGSWLLGCRLSGGEVGRGRTAGPATGSSPRPATGPATGAVAAWVPVLVAARGGGGRRGVRSAAAADAVPGRPGRRLRQELRSRVGRRVGRLRVRAAGRAARRRGAGTGSVWRDRDDDADLKSSGRTADRIVSARRGPGASPTPCKKQVDEKVAAARGFLGSFLGGRRA